MRKSTVLVRISILALAASALAQALHAAPIPPPPGLIYWWPGDGNAVDFRDGNNGTYAGPYVQGKVGPGFGLNGSNHVDTPLTGPQGGAPRTIDAWVKVTNPGGAWLSQTIVDYGNAGTTGAEFLFSVEFPGNRLGLRTHNARKIVEAGKNLVDGQFHHVAVVVPAGATVDGVRFYVDGLPANVKVPYIDPDHGSLNESTPINTAATSSGGKPIRIGAFIDNPSLFTFTGVIDEVQVFGSALSDTNISDLYNAGSDGKCKSRGKAIQALVDSLISMGAMPPPQLTNALIAPNNSAAIGNLTAFEAWLGGGSPATAPLDASEKAALVAHSNYIQAMLSACP